MSLCRWLAGLCMPARAMKQAEEDSLPVPNGLKGSRQADNDVPKAQETSSAHEKDEGKAVRVKDMASILRDRYELQGDVEDLNKATELIQEALKTASQQVPLSELLADILRLRFEKMGNLEDLREAIKILRGALAGCAPRSGDLFRILSALSLSCSLLVRQLPSEDERKGYLLELDSFELPPQQDDEYPTALANFAQAYLYSFYAFAERKELYRSIELYRKALALSKTGERRHATSLVGLADALYLRHQRFGDEAALQTALEYCSTALEETSEGDLHIQCQIDLARAYRARYYRDGDAADLQKSIKYYDDALVHCPPGHIRYPSIIRLRCWSMLHIVEKSGTIEDTQNMITSARQALDLHPQHDTDRRSCLVLLAAALYIHFQRIRESELLDQRIELLAESLRLCPETHPDYANACNGLADAYLERFDWGDEPNVADLDRALEYNDLATKAGTAPPWRYRPKALLHRYLRTKQELDRHAAKEALFEVCRSPYFSHLSRIRLAMQWSSLTQSRGTRFEDLTVAGYELALELRAQLASFRHMDTQTRLSNLASTDDRFASRVAVSVMRVHGAPRAVEVLEQCRAVFWTQALQLRTPFDGLPHDLQKELTETAQKLDATPSADGIMTETQITARKNAVTKFESLLQEARSIPGFEDLLLPKSYDELSMASRDGPVVIIFRDNVAIDSCHVLIIRSPMTPPEHFTLQVSMSQLRNALKDFAVQTRGGALANEPDGPLGGASASRISVPVLWKTQYEELLAKLWIQIVRPVMVKLEFTHSPGSPGRPRIHWCPTGEYAFLPLHAAGLRFTGPASDCALDYAVSSYTPTLGAVLRAQELSEEETAESQRKILVIAQPTTPGLGSLPNTNGEINSLSSILPSSAFIRLRKPGFDADDVELPLTRTNSSVTVAQVVDKLPDASILHLACHGHQDQDSPLDSGFVLNDGRLTVRKLFEMQIPHARLAFLSACETAAGYERLPDEPIHLGMAMLFAGFPNVIATLWSMGDKDGPEVAREVHSRLYDRSLKVWKLDGDSVAYALDEAVRNLISNGVHPSRWATYVHIGA